MKTVELQYGITFGKGDSSDWMEWEIDLTDEEAAIYDHAVENEIPLEDVAELRPVLERAYEEIEAIEIENGIDTEDEYTLECQGLLSMDPDDLNHLVIERDTRALKFFNLEEADDDELDEWDAYDLEELPTIQEFNPAFEPYSPFEAGWTLHVEFADP